MFPARLQVHGFSLQVWSTLVFGEVEHIVHLIHLNLNSRLMPTCGFDRLPSLRGNNARPYFKELNHKWFETFIFSSYIASNLSCGRGTHRHRGLGPHHRAARHHRLWHLHPGPHNMSLHITARHFLDNHQWQCHLLPLHLCPKAHRNTSLDIPQIVTYIGPVDSLRQRSHLSRLFLHNLRHSIHTWLHRRLPLPLHKHELWTHASNNPPSTAPSSTRQGLPAGPPQVQSSLYGLPQHAPPPPMTSPTPATCTSQHSPPDTPPPTAT